MLGKFRQLIADGDGQVAVLIGLLVAVLIAFVSLGVEIVLALYDQRQMQSAADSAALAAATSKLLGNPDWQNEGYAVIANAGFRDGAPGPCTATDTTIYIGTPCDGPHANDAEYVEVLIVQPFSLELARVVNYGEAFLLHGRAVASIEHVSPCACIKDSLKVNGTTALAKFQQCTINAKSAQVTGGATLTCDHLYVGTTAAGVNQALCPTTSNARGCDDPYADIAAPSPTPSNCIASKFTGTSGPSLTLTPAAGSTVATLCDGIDVGTGQTLNLCPGVYIVDGNIGSPRSTFRMNAGTITSDKSSFDASVCTSAGSGVAIVLTSSGSAGRIPAVAVTGGTLKLSGLAAADAASGLPAGMLFFQDRNTATSASNTASFYGNTDLNGVLYFPTVPVVFNGNATGQSSCFQMVAWSLAIGGNPSQTLQGCPLPTRMIVGQAVLVE